MDNLQKGGVKSVAIGIGLMLFSFCFPLLVNVTFKGMLFSYFGVFFSGYLIIMGVAMLRFGDELETKLGPLRSDERRGRIKFYASVFAIPCLIPCVLLYFVLAWHGYKLF